MGYVVDRLGCHLEITDTHLAVRDRAHGEARIPLASVLSVQLGATQRPMTVQVGTADASHEWALGDDAVEAVSALQSAVAHAHAQRRLAAAPPNPLAGPPPSPLAGALGSPDGPPAPPRLGAPAPTVGWDPIAAPGPSGYRSSGTRAKWAVALLGLTVVFILLLAGLMVEGLGLVDKIGVVSIDAEVAQYQQQTASVSGAYLLALIGSAIAFLAWLSRAIGNVPALGGGQPAFSPRAAVAWWFVPIANLFQGYRIVADLWRRMALTGAQRGTVLVLTWWLAWLISNMAMSGLVSADLSTVQALRTYYTAAAALYLLSALSGVLLIAVVWVIERRVRVRAAALAQGWWPAA